jgi:hypothetical protein
MGTKLPLLITTLLCAQLTIADEVPTAVALEEAQKGATLVTEAAGTITDAQLKVEADVDKPMAIKAGSAGLMAIPDKKLTAEVLANAGKEIIAVGQLWMLSVAPAKDGTVVPNHKLRMVTVRQKDKETRVQMFLLGVREAEKDGLELVVYGKDKEPLLKLPLKKAETKHDLPIELKGAKNGEDSGLLTLNFLGRFQAEMTVMKQEN